MNQIALDFSPRAAQVTAALDRAEREIPGWSDIALHFLRNFAARQSELFTAEAVTKAAQEWGMAEPSNPRAWGGVYRRAIKAGIIRQVDCEGRRYNGSPCARYR